MHHNHGGMSGFGQATAYPWDFKHNIILMYKRHIHSHGFIWSLCEQWTFSFPTKLIKLYSSLRQSVFAGAILWGWKQMLFSLMNTKLYEFRNRSLLLLGGRRIDAKFYSVFCSCKSEIIYVFVLIRLEKYLMFSVTSSQKIE